MTAFTMIWAGVLCLGLFVFMTYIRDYAAEQSFWADVAEGLEETSETVSQIHTYKIDDKNVVVFKGNNKKRTYFLDETVLKGVELKIGQTVNLTYIIDPEKSHKNQRAAVLSIDASEKTVDIKEESA